MSRRLHTLLAALCLAPILALSTLAAAASPRVYTFGLSPHKSASALAEDWTPLLARLSERSGVALRFATARDGATLVFPAPTSFAASILPQAELRKQGLAFTPRYVQSHESVYLNVAKGLSPGGGGIQRSLERADPAVRGALRVLWRTRDYSPHAIASHPRVPDEVRARVLAALLEMHGDPDARPLLERVGFKGFEAARDADWDDIRALELKLPE